MVTRGRRDALKKIHGGKERRRYKAMTIMAVESAADVRHRGRRGAGGGNLIILRAFSLATFKQLQRIFSARPSRCLYPLPSPPVPRLMGRNERITLQDCRDISNGKGGRGGRFLFLIFFFVRWKKKWKKIHPPPSRGGIGSDYSREPCQFQLPTV